MPWLSIFKSLPAWSIGITTFGRIWIHYTFIISGPLYMKTILGFDIQTVSYWYFGVGYTTLEFLFFFYLNLNLQAIPSTYTRVGINTSNYKNAKQEQASSRYKKSQLKLAKNLSTLCKKSRLIQSYEYRPDFIKPMRIDYLQNGLMNGMPFLCSYFASVMFCYVADQLIIHKILTLTNIRKIFTALCKYHIEGKAISVP